MWRVCRGGRRRWGKGGRGEGNGDGVGGKKGERCSFFIWCGCGV